MAKHILFTALLFCTLHRMAQDTLSITLENVKYPYPVEYLSINTDGQDVRMAYMDIRPDNANGRSVMLFHGKNFGGYYWTDVIHALSEKGYRVIVPDQPLYSNLCYFGYSFKFVSKQDTHNLTM